MPGLATKKTSLALACALAGLLPALAGADDAAAERRQQREKARAELAREVKDLEKFSQAFRKVAAIARPSVVHIEARRKIARVRPELPDGGGWEELWKHLRPEGTDGFDLEVSTGTGFLLDERGSILTNNHVVGGSDEILAKLDDDRTFRAKVVGRDARSDLAVVRLQGAPADLEAAVLGDSDALDVGDWVIAIGNPFGLDQTVTAGIISAKGRANVGVAEYEDFIQTDAAINPGNSGGPLLNLRGEVVGVNTAIASRTGGYQGIGFSIPINMAKDIAAKLEESGKVTRGWLGVSVQEMTRELAPRFDMGDRKGLLISGVTPAGPADKAGLRAGDVILTFDGKPVSDMQRLRRLVAGTPVKKKVLVGVWRDARAVPVGVELGELVEPGASGHGPLPPETPSDEGAAPARLGISARAFTPELARTYGYRGDETGVLITEVEPGSLAAFAGIVPGSLLVEIDRKKVASMEDLDLALGKIDLEKGVLLLLRGPDAISRYVLLRKS
jgi:serine protease Do